MAEQVGHPHAIGLVAMARGIAFFLSGQWKQSTALCERALTLFRDECTGVNWEVALAQDFLLGSLLFRGELRDVSHTMPGLLQAVRERGNLYFETELRTRMNLVWLANDEPDDGERQANEAIGRWSGSGFYRQHYNHLLARVQTALYRGRARDAWRLMSEELPPLRRSLWLRVQFLRIETAFMHARCALAMAAEGRDAKRMRAIAEHDARRLERERIPWSNALARLIRATLAHQSGDVETAVDRLAQTVDAFSRADMHLYEAVCRRRLAALVGGDRGRALEREAQDWMTAQTVRNPPAIARLIAPGFPG
jgi:hypothetical protein